MTEQLELISTEQRTWWLSAEERRAGLDGVRKARESLRAAVARRGEEQDATRQRSAA